MNDSLVGLGQKVLTEPNLLRSILILIGSILLAYWLSRFLAQAIVWVAGKVASRGDKEADDLKNLRYRQVETYLSIAVALIRASITVAVAYLAWSMLNPIHGDNQTTSNSLAAIGAGTVFILFAGQTVGVLLRDLTAGAIMITEGWFHVGDYIKVEPFGDASGVVERFTLRSTRLRALNGEIIWVHNQYVQAAHVTPYGVRTMAVEIFLRDKEAGVEAVQKVIDAIPTGKTMLAQPLVIEKVEPWADGAWHLTVRGKTLPGREWLIDTYFFEAIKAIDENKSPEEALLALPPMVHMADSTADKRFKRAVRVK